VYDGGVSGLTRRSLLGGALAAARPGGLIIDTHVHLFDPKRFPYHANATYQPPAAALEPYAAFVREVKLDHVVIVHPEPYQDDHRYLEYCFAHEPSPGFFKGTCLFDPIAPDTPARMQALVRRNPKRIVALRIHEMHAPGTPPLTAGPIKDRDLRSPAMRTTWRAAADLGIAIQMHFLPAYAAQIGELAAAFPGMAVILDHLARAGQGTPAEFDQVLQLARYPGVVMKYSAINYSSKQPYPFADARPLVRRAYDAFGPARMIWGGLGQNRAEFDRQSALFEQMFEFAPADARARIGGLNAKTLFGF
jgi:predicted TIM-barrel fold metal-dependent hydrolase